MSSLFRRALTKTAAIAAFGIIGSTGLIGTAQAATTIGIEYQHSNYSGSSTIYTAPTNGYTCTASTANVDRQVSTVGMNDQISSFRNYANCWTKHYEHSNFGGASVGYSPAQSYIGNAMNDRTSSIRWS